MVILTPSSQRSLVVSIVGESRTGLYVHEVNGCGQLKPGDQILEVDGARCGERILLMYSFT